MKNRLSADLENALVQILNEGASPDPVVRALAQDALFLAKACGVSWLDQITVVHLTDPADTPPVILAAWKDTAC